MSKIRAFDTDVTDNSRILSKISDYINQLPVTSQFKHIISDAKFSQSNPGYYVNYPYLFSNRQEDERIDFLCIAGYLYYQSIIYLDQALDKKGPISQLFPIINICEEESVRLLSSIFGLNSPFWTLWQQRKVEYFTAYQIDMTTHSVASFEDFENLADKKSTFGKLAIDALYILSELSEETYRKCLLLHKLFYSAFQILDDILDIREDNVSGQFNIATSLLKHEIADGNINKEALDSADNMVKYVHIFGISNILYAKAEEYIQKAEALAKELNLPYMLSEIAIMHNTIINHRLTVSGYLKTIKAKANLSEQFMPHASVSTAVHAGLKYLQQQQHGGAWEEICNNAGVSNTWATGYITSFLNEITYVNGVQGMVAQAVTYLKNNENENAWGYNTGWIVDNDSTNFALLAIVPYCNTSYEEVALAHKFDKLSGGVSTYSDKHNLICSLSNKGLYKANVDGWTQPHPCVSAVSLYFISKNFFPGEEQEHLLKYNINYLKSNKPLAYWWTNDIYSIYFLLKANSNLLDKEMRILLESRVKCKIEEYENGRMEKSVFNLGLLLLCLMEDDTIDCKNNHLAEQLINEILALQYADGSWKASNAMCIPATDNVHPIDTEKWAISSYGVNIRALEYNRLFSTVIAVTALSIYGRKYNGF